MSLAGKLAIDDNYFPPNYERPPGRPQKKRKERPALRMTNVRRRCKACGEEGHFESSCEDPVTQFRVNSHLKETMKCCMEVRKQSNEMEIEE